MTAYLSEPRRRTTGRARGRSAPVGDLYDFASLTLAGFCVCSPQSSQLNSTNGTEHINRFGIVA
jgi:hypothetical protein